jgi:NADH-quinone oxidoreductase subunit H
VVLAGVTTAVFLGGYHLPFGEEWVKHVFDNVTWAPGWMASIMSKLWAPFLALVFWLKVIFLVYIQLAVRWSFPRFRYDQIQKLGWQMLLPAGIFNVFVSGALVLWDPSLKALAVMGILEILALIMLIPATQPDGAHGHAPAAAGGHGGH